MQAISALCIASEIIKRRQELGQSSPTNLDIQKFSYFCHGWHLALMGDPLVDELFEAWKLGPVLPSIYSKFKVFSLNPIPADHPLIIAENPLERDSDRSKLIDRVLAVYGNSSSHDLVRMSNVTEGPWAEAWISDRTSSNINNASIKAFFKEKSCRLESKEAKVAMTNTLTELPPPEGRGFLNNYCRAYR
jgi:uncharacterized phage-associated protein